MTIRILDTTGELVELSDTQADVIFDAMSGPGDPRISSCVTCRSAVIATEPFSTLLDELSTTRVDESEMIGQLVDLVENSEDVHLYIWEENECVHMLWRDPLAAEWSSVTGEKRLHH